MNNKIWMSSELATTAKDVAWRQRRTFGAVVREILNDYLEHGNEANLAPIDVPAHEARLTYKVNDDIWQKVRERAEREGVSIAGIIRRGIVARTTGVNA